MVNKKIKIIALTGRIKLLPLIKEQLLKRNFDFETIEIPEITYFDLGKSSAYKLKELRNQIKKQDNEIIVFLPYTAELFFDEPDFIIGFSGYKSWFDCKRFKVIPYIWGNANIKDDLLNEVLWQEKPNLSVGFLGRSYEGKSVNLALHFPKLIKQWFLSGKHLKYIYNLNHKRAVTLICIPCFARVEALREIKKSNINSEINQYSSNYVPQEPDIKRYQEHMLKNTYILCPRGVENYSFRFYETLAFGRVPILIDTDMVLPLGINWDDLCIKIPYNNLNELEARIRQDYDTKTKQDFLERQKKALETIKQLNKLNWLENIVDEIIQAVLD
jgi:hypothetical protein